MKYRLKDYITALGYVVTFMEDKPELVNQMIQETIEPSDKEMVRDLFNLW